MEVRAAFDEGILYEPAPVNTAAVITAPQFFDTSHAWPSDFALLPTHMLARKTLKKESRKGEPGVGDSTATRETKRERENTAAGRGQKLNP